jgi:hypothetical protein
VSSFPKLCRYFLVNIRHTFPTIRINSEPATSVLIHIFPKYLFRNVQYCLDVIYFLKCTIIKNFYLINFPQLKWLIHANRYELSGKNIYLKIGRFEVFTEMKVLTPCSDVTEYRRFGGHSVSNFTGKLLRYHINTRRYNSEDHDFNICKLLYSVRKNSSQKIKKKFLPCGREFVIKHSS